MDVVSKQRRFSNGVLISLGILLIGYLLNPIIGTIGLVRLVWPQNLYFLLILSTLGLCIGIISDSGFIKRITDGSFVTAAGSVLFVLALHIFIWPERAAGVIPISLFETPALFLSVFLSIVVGAYIGKSLAEFKKDWSGVLVVVALLLFCYSTVMAQRDYYKLSMRIGEDRALFEAEDDSGKYYRLPFAVKLLANNENPNIQNEIGIEAKVRFFNTVSDYKDVLLNDCNNYRLKGWVISKKNESGRNADQLKLADLSLVFDRWIELKYISLGLLIVSLLLRFKY